jgi:hypothetical protein
MVLLFLGIAFALVGWNATRSSDDSDSTESSSVSTVTSATASASASSTTPPPAAKADVRVYNASGPNGVPGAAAGVGDRLKAAEWNVTDVTNLEIEGVTVTTVFYGETAGEKEAAEAVGQLLAAPVELRVPGLAEQPPGVIVAVIS